MKTTMEEKITVAKIPLVGYSYICMKCNMNLEYEWKFCGNCGTELNVGAQ